MTTQDLNMSFLSSTIADGKKENASTKVSEALRAKRNQEKLKSIVQPGRISTHIDIQIHTKNAYSLIIGRKNDEHNQYRSSLFMFQSQIKEIINNAFLDDPYADWVLIQIEAAIADATQLIKDELATALARVESQKKDGRLINRLENSSPSVIPMLFGSQYGIKTGMLISDYDLLLRWMIPLRSAGFITVDEWKIFTHRIAKAISHVLNLASKYRSTKTTREMIINHPDSMEVKQIKLKAGSVPLDILNCQRLPKFCPEINRHKKEQLPVEQSSEQIEKIMFKVNFGAIRNVNDEE